MKQEEIDQKFIRRTIALSEVALKHDGAPFGALIVKDGKIIAESANDSKGRVSNHAEVLALDSAHKKLKTSDLSGCTLYSNCEPCPMCSFMAREYKVSRVVFAIPSPFMGGYSKWDILQDDEITQFKPFFSTPPKVISGIFEKEAMAVFKKTPLWWIFGSDAKNNRPTRL